MLHQNICQANIKVCKHCRERKGREGELFKEKYMKLLKRRCQTSLAISQMQRTEFNMGKQKLIINNNSNNSHELP